MAKDVRRRPHCVQTRKMRFELENSGEVGSLALKIPWTQRSELRTQRWTLPPIRALGFWREMGYALRFEVLGHRAGTRAPQQGFLQTRGMKCHRNPNEGPGSCVFVKDDFN